MTHREQVLEVLQLWNNKMSTYKYALNGHEDLDNKFFTIWNVVGLDHGEAICFDDLPDMIEEYNKQRGANVSVEEVEKLLCIL